MVKECDTCQCLGRAWCSSVHPSSVKKMPFGLLMGGNFKPT